MATIIEIFGSVRNYFTRALRHPLGFLGLNGASLSGVLLVTLLVLDFTGYHGNPYLGILTFLILPIVFVCSLLLIPIGEFRYKKRLLRRKPSKELPLYLSLDLNNPRHRNRFTVIAILTLVNFTILGIVSFRGMEFMDSVHFCGETCHQVMNPEWVAHQNSPHARVLCVDCHIGSGADWYVKAKLSGVRQVFATLFNTFPRPIPTPIHNLRPARDTCEQCHWPEKFHGDKVKVIPHFEDDEANTELKTVLLLKVGGGVAGNQDRGIHWHVLNHVEYDSDESRENIYNIRVIQSNGDTLRYAWKGKEPPKNEILEPRVMDCVDCHNRPTHIYSMPDAALDNALFWGVIPQSLPNIRGIGYRVLTTKYASREDAAIRIPELLRAGYQDKHPSVLQEMDPELSRTAQTLVGIYNKNIFPSMNVDWGTYPNHLGHEDFPGCFRCHDEEHVAENGDAISQDCSTCHTLLAIEEQDPKVLEVIFPKE
ncbi:MAG: NapC/NirT family cytochrome c [Candidatus Eisenbacteria bacterium]|uniref:NapC/NirT family cytochrome c n=1 Tax=Eiseniibacteriota bacterium TaxID=2212470 RepID=A0A948S0D8_UNCEI|nr:NapC/NirT family cytochrome c [Candidatus Eisenbacteria bacterium]MBU1949008.1 NapC/NirT family cytochrome c [Candidatus Eisenbacteria bacterium]MBU2691519.1 NapC/NirT family cytochrome c [Candidatus Eisenbacteria bacterium]